MLGLKLQRHPEGIELTCPTHEVVALVSVLIQDSLQLVTPSFRALSSGDTELLEYAYPIIIRRYGLIPDSGGAGAYRGGSGTVWEVEPIDHEMMTARGGLRARPLPRDNSLAVLDQDP